jgi:hypothetical protein
MRHPQNPQQKVLAYRHKELGLGVTDPVEHEAIPSFPHDPQERGSGGRAEQGRPILVGTTKGIDHIFE